MATKYINADTGNDTTGNGTSSLPYLTLAKGLATTSAGDTIYCQNSTATYAFENATYTNKTIRGESTTGVVFDGGGASKSWTSGTGTASVSTLTIQNLSNIDFINVIALSTGSVQTLTVSNIIFKDITVVTGYGCLIGNNAWSAGLLDITINSCVFNNIAQTYAGGYYGLISLIDPDPASIVRMNNCTYFNNRANNAATSVFTGRANTFTVRVKNSIFRNSSTSMRIFNYPVNLTMTNCCYNGTWTNTGTLTNCITTNPLSIDENNGNFRLRPTSPCIGTGTIL